MDPAIKPFEIDSLKAAIAFECQSRSPQQCMDEAELILALGLGDEPPENEPEGLLVVADAIIDPSAATPHRPDQPAAA